MKRLIPILALSLLLLLSGCAVPAGQAGGAPAPDKLRVITTNFPPYDFLRQIAGENAELSVLLPPGGDSHSFEPTPQDIIRISECDLFVHVGGESEAWVDRILAAPDTRPARVIALLDLVETVEEETVEGMETGREDHDHDHEDHDHEEHRHGTDEHVWTSPRNAMAIVDKLAAALCEIDAPNAGTYADNAAAYRGRLEELDDRFASIVEAGSRKVLLFGDRFPFRYFADAYGLSYYAAFPGCAAETEASSATLAFLIDKSKAEGIPVVFHIELSSQKIADTICQAAGAEKRLFHSCHNLSRAEQEAGETYLSLMSANADRLEEALG